MDDTFPIKKTQLTWSWSYCNFVAPSSGVVIQATSSGATGPSFLDHSHRPTIHLWLSPSWGNLVHWWWFESSHEQLQHNVPSGSRSRGTNFAITHFMPRSCLRILDTVVFGIPTSASISCIVSHWFLCIAAHTHSTFSGVLLVAGLPECGSISTDSWPPLKHLCHTFICAALIASSPKAFWIIQIVSTSNVQA